MPRLILASGSPRRRALLGEAGYDFTVEPADIDESFYPSGLLPPEVATYLAGAKADAVASKFPDEVILAADTVVALGDEMLGKPQDENDARRILMTLSGTTHVVITGVAVVHRATGLRRLDRAMSAVRMAMLSARQIEDYLRTGEWMGKAGAYGIQDQREDAFVSKVTGSFTNIVGLPMSLARGMLAEAGMSPRRQD